MPTDSPHPPISVPHVDLWTFLFERADREYPDDHGKFSSSAELIGRRD